jgi:hypothetical protein
MNDGNQPDEYSEVQQPWQPCCTTPTHIGAYHLDVGDA